MLDILSIGAHRPFAMPQRSWRMRQRWNDLLFAHWPIHKQAVSALLPPGLEIDTFDGWAWVGVVPFHMDQVEVRASLGPNPGEKSFKVPHANNFPELNLRTYVRSTDTHQPGVYFFSLDAASLLAVIGARALFSLPYHWAAMESKTEANGTIHYRSKRLLGRTRVEFAASYRSLGMPAQGPLEDFLTARYCLYTRRAGQLLVGNIHHLPWPLEAAEADFELNQLPLASGITLPNRPPVLHYSRELVVYVWTLQQLRDRPVVAAIPA